MFTTYADRRTMLKGAMLGAAAFTLASRPGLPLSPQRAAYRAARRFGLRQRRLYRERARRGDAAQRGPSDRRKRNAARGRRLGHLGRRDSAWARAERRYASCGERRRQRRAALFADPRREGRARSPRRSKGLPTCARHSRATTARCSTRSRRAACRRRFAPSTRRASRTGSSAGRPRQVSRCSTTASRAKPPRAGSRVIDLRVICSDDEDLANPIEPSVIGGAKIANAIADLCRRLRFPHRPGRGVCRRSRQDIEQPARGRHASGGEASFGRLGRDVGVEHESSLGAADAGFVRPPPLVARPQGLGGNR